MSQMLHDFRRCFVLGLLSFTAPSLIPTRQYIERRKARLLEMKAFCLEIIEILDRMDEATKKMLNECRARLN